VAYLDHAATTPVLPEVRAAVLDAMELGGNASSVHASGRRARRLAEESRETVAAALGARPSEVVFTSGGTESDNLAIKGLFWDRHDQDLRRRRILVSSIEHHAVLDAVEWLVAHEGAEVTWLEVDHLGQVRPEVLEAALGDDVALVSVMWANNEVGTVQPIAALAEIAHRHGVPFHTDAVQALGHLPVDFTASGVDAMTVTGHKYGGPLGAGVLLLGRTTTLTPLLHGGGQERDVRSGTLAVPSVAGLALATRLAVDRQAAQAVALAALRDDLVARVQAAVPEAVLNGDPVHRLPGNAHFSFPGCEGDSLLLLLDAQGVEVSTGSACSAGVAAPSHVLVAMGAADARSSLRFSLGHTSTAADVDALLDVLPGAVARASTAVQR
jgi:cysteine desulfurase